MSGTMGAEAALQVAVLTALRADAGIRAKFGEPARVFEQTPRKAAYPYIELVRQESRPVDGAAAAMSEHRIDVAVVAREADMASASEGLLLVRNAVLGAALAPEGWRCALITPVYAGLAPTPEGDWRALVRFKALLEPA